MRWVLVGDDAGHDPKLCYQVKQNRIVAREVNAAGGQVLLDQRIRALGCHHQKLVVIRHHRGPRDDVAFVGGIDLDNGSRDDAAHRGDPQLEVSDDEYDRAPRHDMQVELRGPAVRDVEDAFRERWEDPAPLTRLPWHTIPDRVHRLPRTATPLPPPASAPRPRAAARCRSCAPTPVAGRRTRSRHWGNAASPAHTPRH